MKRLVVYLLKNNCDHDTEVLDEYNGFIIGLTLYVDPKERRVNSASNLMTQSYEASEYEIETDIKKLTTLAEKVAWVVWL